MLIPLVNDISNESKHKNNSNKDTWARNNDVKDIKNNNLVLDKDIVEMEMIDRNIIVKQEENNDKVIGLKNKIDCETKDNNSNFQGPKQQKSFISAIK